ncbi:CsbD-like protein [Oceaniovalibus guishaninsula JLT2003]|uniref:CsbD-like protein n=1 Tax=Oceaniovalibus guishaninsula JLT2003 TaxID=1231392 RepID=K2GNY6_9RHOB|nr:CsbD family protein [Oceaniovalibus guishaninsula]EKE44401.1 CsbD-like protein [Oceaniovalibus guishaninsula JLT2003]
MDEDRVKGSGKDMAGKAQEKLGEVTGNKETEAKGEAKQAEGKTQKAWGETKDAVRGKD